MKTKILILTMLLSCIAAGEINAQKSNKKILLTGIVQDQNKQPIMNAMITVDGVHSDVITDATGKFKMKVKPDAKRIGAVLLGGGIVEEDISGRTEIALTLNRKSTGQEQQAEKQEDEAVNTGYNKVKQKNLTTEISTVSTKGSKTTYTNIRDMLAQVPGITIKGGQVIVQNAQDLMGSVPPLYVVDGQVVDDISYISPVTVEKIEVLKGPAATIYGSRAVGGVILITIKKQ